MDKEQAKKYISGRLMYNSLDHAVYSIEKEYGVQGIQSECQGLCYLQDDEKKKLGILSYIGGRVTCVILKKNQVKALIKELQDICDVVFN